jgi:hypothetical protein
VLNSTAFIAITGNGLTVSEDLARRFINCKLDAGCEDPESRSFETWCNWVRDPLLTLGCRDPVERIEMLKAHDPYRQNIAELFKAQGLVEASQG